MSREFSESNKDISMQNSKKGIKSEAKMKQKKFIAAIDIWRLRRRMKKKATITQQKNSNSDQETVNEDAQIPSYSFDHSFLEIPPNDTEIILDSPEILISEPLSFEPHYPPDASLQSSTPDENQNTEKYLSLPYNINYGYSQEVPCIPLDKRLNSLIETKRFSYESNSHTDLISTSKLQFDQGCSFDMKTDKSRAINKSVPCLRAASCKSPPTKSLTIEEFSSFFTNQVSGSTGERIKMRNSHMPLIERKRRSGSISSIESLEEGLCEIFHCDIRSSRGSLHNHTNLLESTLDTLEELSLKEVKDLDKEEVKDIEEECITATGGLSSEECEKSKTIKGLAEAVTSTGF